MPTSITRMVCDVRIGTSGFHYKFQVQKFDTVELNNSFYRPADCQRPSARVTGRCSRLTPFPCATRPADTSCRAIRSHHSTM